MVLCVRPEPSSRLRTFLVRVTCRPAALFAAHEAFLVASTTIVVPNSLIARVVAAIIAASVVAASVVAASVVVAVVTAVVASVGVEGVAVLLL